METWIAVPGYEGWYEVSDLGRVRKIRRALRGHSRNFTDPLPFILMPLLYRKGYHKIHFASCDGTRPERRVFLHRLVYEAFNGPGGSGLTINHKNGDKTDNALTNLELVTHRQNTRHAFANGLIRKRDGRPNVRKTISDEDAREAKRLYDAGGWTFAALGRRYAMDPTSMRYIVRRCRTVL